MADKSFEQQVKEQLADLRMNPDASLWLNVEATLHKERKRRWQIWFFLLLAGCCGASFLAYYQFSKTRQQVSAMAKKTTIISKQPAKEKAAIAVTEKIQIAASIQPFTPGKFPGRSKAEKGSSSPVVTINNNDFLPVKPIAEVIIDPVVNRIRMVLPGQRQAIIDTPNANKIIGIDKPVITVQTITTQAADTIFVKNEKETQEQEILPKPTVKAGDPPGTTVKKNKKNKWQWNIVFDAGTSGIRRSLGKGSTAFNAYATNPANSTGSTVGQSQNIIPVFKNAFSFGMQLQANKPISKKHSIGISLGYSLFQTGINVGRRIDSSVYFSGLSSYNTNGYYYNSADSVGYTNQYHFLRAGFELYAPFKLFKTVSMRWQLGSGLNMLIATNGLHFDANSGRLFRNNSLMTSVQTHFSAGFSFAIGKQPFIYVGPHWQYFISNLSKETGTDQHLFLSAVKATFILDKKKK